MFADFLPILDSQSLISSSLSKEGFGYSPAPIVLHEFVDIDWDAKGWYAIGHHQPKAFITAVAKHEPRYKLRESHVEHLWACIEGYQIEWLEEPIGEAKPVTYILLLAPL